MKPPNYYKETYSTYPGKRKYKCKKLKGDHNFVFIKSEYWPEVARYLQRDDISTKHPMESRYQYIFHRYVCSACGKRKMKIEERKFNGI